MSGFKWDDYPVEGASKKFDWNDFPAEGANKEESGVLPTVVDKLASGLTSGFADEASGGMEALGRAAGIEGLGGKIKDLGISPEGPTTDWEVLKHAYMHGRDKDRQVLKQEQKEHPFISNAAEIGGMVASPVNKLAGGMSLTKGGALLGGLSGLGNSDSETLPGMALDTGTGAAFGAAGGKLIEKANPYIQKGASFVSDKLADASQKLAKTPVENLEQLTAAAQRLGIEPVEAMKTSNPNFQKLESGLSQSGSFPAMEARENYNKMFKGLDQASEKVSGLKTPDSDFSLGQGIRDQLSEKINATKAPITEMYKDVMPDLQKIPVNEKVVNKVIGQLKNDPIFQTADGKAFLAEHKDILLNQPELASLKEYRSSLKGLTNDMSLPVDQMKSNAMQRAATSIRDNSIEALKADLPKNMHGEVDDLIDRIALADSAHSSLLNDINSVKSLFGNKDFSSPSTFLNKLGSSKEADLTQKASNLDISSLQNMKSKFPEVFEKAKTAKINDMIQRSTNPIKGFNENAFFKQYQNIDPELKDLLFTPEMQSHISDLQTFKQAIPEKLGPSGTPEGMMTMDMFSPKRNLYDYLIKKSLNKADNASGLLSNLSNKANSLDQGLNPGGNVFNLEKSPLQLAPRFIENAPTKLPKAADEQDQDKIIQNKQKSGGDDVSQIINTNPEALGKFAPVLQSAQQRGPQGLAATHFILQSTNPEYRQMLMRAAGNPNEGL